jgi:hypothetical protein
LRSSLQRGIGRHALISFTPPIAFPKHTPDSVEENTPNNLGNDTVILRIIRHEEPSESCHKAGMFERQRLFGIDGPRRFGGLGWTRKMRKRDMNERALSDFIAGPLCRHKRRVIGLNLDFCDFVGDDLSWTHFNLEGLSSVFVGSYNKLNRFLWILAYWYGFSELMLVPDPTKAAQNDQRS